jgi:hypothetical protein
MVALSFRAKKETIGAIFIVWQKLQNYTCFVNGKGRNL